MHDITVRKVKFEFPDELDDILPGDDIDSDVAGAQAAGIRGLLVQTGKYRDTALQRAAVTPDAVLPSIAALPDWLQAEGG